jgi:hypothetical protein
MYEHRGRELRYHSPAMTFYTIFIAQVQFQDPCGFIRQAQVKCVGLDEIQGAAEAITVTNNRLKRSGGGEVLDVLGLRPVELVRCG